MKKIALAILGMTMIVSSCKKKDAECSLSTASMIGSYKITAIKYKASAIVPEVDVTNDQILGLKSCELDDIYQFAANSVYNYKVGGVACSPILYDNTGTWTLSGTTLNFDGESYIVSQFNCSEFQIYQSDFITNGDKMTIYFTRQ